MKNRYVVRFLAVVCLLLFGLVVQSAAQTVNVTFVCNTATCLDTLRPNHSVQLLGESKQATTPAMSWTTGAGLILANAGGDYWKGTLQAHVGDTVKYKFWTGFTATTGTFHWTGWEGPIDAGIPSGDNRMLIVGTQDTTLPVQFFNGWETKVAQYWRPYVEKPDTLAVLFRVNMGGIVFNPATQVVNVSGGLPLGQASPWIVVKTLAQEANSVNSGSFWSGVAYLPKDSVTAGTTQQQWKFVIMPDNIWEGDPPGNRSFTFSSKGDTTIPWYYFNDKAPSGPMVTSNVLFILKLEALERANFFNRALGDKVAVTGAKGWPPTTWVFDTEPTMLKMTYDPGAKEWSRLDAYTLYPNDAINYKYYIAWDSSRVDTASLNYIPGLQLTDGWEEPGATGGADRKYFFQNSTADQIIPGDFGADQQFFNSLHWKGVITHPFQVEFRINMAPAANATTNPGALFRPGIDTVYIQFDGCLVPVTQGKTMYGTDNRLMLEDKDGDGIYTGIDTLTPPTFYQYCYRIAYTSPGVSGGILNGSGSAIRGRRYYQYAWPTQVKADSAVWPATYSLAVMPWKLDNLTIEDPPNLDVISGIAEGNGDVPRVYALYQNYPNPFNPSTVVTYAVPKASHVTLTVYNVLGQKVASLFDGEQAVGTHSVAWNGTNHRGASVSSGMYLLKMQAGSFSQVRKMMLAR